MTTYTKAQFATRIMRENGLLGADETASSADQDWAEQTIDSTFKALQRKGIRIWDASEDAISDEYLVPLSQYVACDVSPAFGLMTIADAAATKRVLEADLRALAAVLPTGEEAEATHY